MPSDPRVDDLLLDWEERNERGEAVAVEELCRDCPELVGEVKRRIAALESMARFLDKTAEMPREEDQRSDTERIVRAPVRHVPDSETDFQELLRQRLLVCAWCSILTVALVTLHSASGISESYRLIVRGTPGVVLTGATAAVLAALIVWLNRPRGASTRRLRAAELTILGWFAAYLANVQFTTIVNAEPASGFEGPGHMRNAVSFVSLSVQIIWFGFIVVYGVCVPNTARRCAFMMAGLALTHFGTLGASAWFSAAVREMLPVLLFWGCGITVTAMAMAVFGSLRLTALQKEVIEARPAMRELGQYQLQRQLGAGGMGEVYLAEHRLLKRPCAVKLIRPERAGDASTLRRFEREVRATTRLTHPNTIQIYDFGNTASGTIFYVMEYLSGLSLEEMVKRHGPLPPGRAVYLLRQLCGALHEAHLLGMVHRDLKPSNVMICEIGGQHDVAKLLDFGLVQEGDRAATQLTHEGIILGTPSYMSPEQVDGRDRVDARSDMYSLGATAYFALTGEPPFTRESALAVMLAHLIRGDCSP